MIPPTAAPRDFPLAAALGVCAGPWAGCPAPVAFGAAVVPAPVSPVDDGSSPMTRSAAALSDPSLAGDVLAGPAAAVVLSAAALVLTGTFVVVVEAASCAAPPVGTGNGPVYRFPFRPSLRVYAPVIRLPVVPVPSWKSLVYMS